VSLNAPYTLCNIHNTEREDGYFTSQAKNIISWIAFLCYILCVVGSYVNLGAVLHKFCDRNFPFLCVTCSQYPCPIIGVCFCM
jgi:hypothetical protein